MANVLLLNKIQPDGKRLHYYVFEHIVYLFTIQWKNIYYFNEVRFKQSEKHEKCMKKPDKYSELFLFRSIGSYLDKFISHVSI